MEFARIDPVKKMACQHCRAVLPDWTAEEVLNSPKLTCPSCGGQVKLPDEVMERLRSSRHLGRNLDITG